jgi:hypothetical protein
MPQNDSQQRAIPFADSPLQSKNVLGDNPQIQQNSTQDTLGRGRKGYAHGSIAYKTITHRRKSGKSVTYQQAWYQWEDKIGKHSRYLNQKQARRVRIMLDRGAQVPQILALLDKKSSGTQLLLTAEPSPESKLSGQKNEQAPGRTQP